MEPLGLGGPTNDGTVYEFVSATQSLVTLATFDGTNGSQPEGGLIRDANGIFYGTTLGGGAYGDGSVFKFDPSTGVVTTLASFNGGDLTGPMGGLVFGADGNLYGTTWGGGDNGMGTVFEVSVPEPGSLSIIAASALGVLVHRRHSISETKSQQECHNTPGFLAKGLPAAHPVNSILRRGIVLLNPSNDFPRGDSHSGADSKQHIDSGRVDAALQMADVLTADPCFCGDLFLCEACGFPSFPQFRSEHRDEN